MIPGFQGRGIATRASAQVLALARAEKQRQFVHSFPSVNNGPSNAICRKLGFTLLEERDFEYPPGTGKVLRCNRPAVRPLRKRLETVGGPVAEIILVPIHSPS